jgi:hypothetical protein
MDESRTDDISQVTVEENNLVTALYIEKEVNKAFSKWNTTKPQIQMASQLNFIKLSRKLSNMTFSSCSFFYILDNLSCFA